MSSIIELQNFRCWNFYIWLGYVWKAGWLWCLKKAAQIWSDAHTMWFFFRTFNIPIIIVLLTFVILFPEQLICLSLGQNFPLNTLLKPIVHIHHFPKHLWIRPLHVIIAKGRTLMFRVGPVGGKRVIWCDN